MAGRPFFESAMRFDRPAGEFLEMLIGERLNHVGLGVVSVWQRCDLLEDGLIMGPGYLRYQG